MRSGLSALLNLTAGFGPPDEKWEITVVGKNLTDESYFIVADDIPLFPLNYGRGQARPRSVGLQFRWRFF